MGKINIEIPQVINQRKLDKMVNKLNVCITKTLDKSCPEVKAKLINLNNPWWTPQLQDMRKEVTALHKRLILSPIQQNQLNYKRVLRKYKNKCRKLKLKHDKYIQEIIPDESGMAKHAKKLIAQISPKLGTLEKADGTHTLVGEETFKELLTKHYPEHTYTKETEYDRSKTTNLAELNDLYNDWINTDRIILALNKFKAKKSPGPDKLKPIRFKHGRRGSARSRNHVHTTTGKTL